MTSSKYKISNQIKDDVHNSMLTTSLYILLYFIICDLEHQKFPETY